MHQIRRPFFEKGFLFSRGLSHEGVLAEFCQSYSVSDLVCGRASKAFKNSPSRLLFCSLATNLLCETVAITGLTLFLLTRNPLSFYPFLVLSLTLFAYFFPRYDQWKEWVAKVEGVDAPVVWLPQSLFPRPEFYQGGAPAPGIFPGQPEGSHLRQAAQDGMHRSA